MVLLKEREEECVHNLILEVNATAFDPFEVKYMDICSKCGKSKTVNIEELKKRNIDRMIIKEIEKREDARIRSLELKKERNENN